MTGPEVTRDEAVSWAGRVGDGTGNHVSDDDGVDALVGELARTVVALYDQVEGWQNEARHLDLAAKQLASDVGALRACVDRLRNGWVSIGVRGDLRWARGHAGTDEPMTPAEQAVMSQ